MINISIAAKKLFCNPNCIGEKIRLKIILSTKGRKTIKGICDFINIQKTLPKEIAIKIYRNAQTGPNNHDGGAHVGLIRV